MPFTAVPTPSPRRAERRRSLIADNLGFGFRAVAAPTIRGEALPGQLGHHRGLSRRDLAEQQGLSQTQVSRLLTRLLGRLRRLAGGIEP
jgi:hypothetical protein